MYTPPFKKTYLSRAQSRAWSMENPVGDPYGGPAYGEKREPVSMIAAVVAIGVGASTVAAATTLTLAAVMGGLMIAGGAMTLIGTVSDNKNLKMIGSITAGVGGLGLAAGSMFADAAASAATAAETTADGVNAASASAQGSGLTTGSADVATGGVMGNGTDIATQVPTAADAAPGAFNTPVDGSLASQNAVAQSSGNTGLIDSVMPSSPTGLDSNLAGGVANTGPSYVDDLTNTLSNNIADASATTLQPSPYESLADASGNTQLVEKAGTAGADLSKHVNDPNYIEALNGTPPANNYAAQIKLPNGSDFGTTNAQGQVFDSSGNYIGQAPGFEVAGKPTVTGSATLSQDGSSSGGWLDKIEGLAKGIEKYKTTAMLGGNLISGAMKYAIPSQSDQAAIDLYNAKSNLANAEANAINSLEERKRRQNEAVKNIKTPQLNNPLNPIFGNALNGAGIINSARA